MPMLAPGRLEVRAARPLETLPAPLEPAPRRDTRPVRRPPGGPPRLAAQDMALSVCNLTGRP